MSKILSIIIPAYNVEKYIKECLESMVVPNMMDKVEVLIINDGSSDNTENIARKYCIKYPDTYIIINKKNGGHGSGINYGIKYATGKYFKVVDGDDWLNKDELEEFIQLLEGHDEDIIATDFKCICDGSYKILENKRCTRNENDYGKVKFFDKDSIEDVIKMHSLTIKTSILQENKIKIDENCFYVDCEYITFPIMYVNNVYYYQRYIYMYRLGRDGQSMNIKSMQKKRNQHMFVLNQLLNYYDYVVGKGCTESKKRYIQRCIGEMVENQFQIMISLGLKRGIRKELKDWDVKMKEKYPEIYKSTRKKSISLLRMTHYYILPLGAVAYRLMRN